MTIVERLKQLMKTSALELPNGLLVGMALMGMVAIKTEIEANKLRGQALEQAESLKRLPPTLREEILKMDMQACLELSNQRVPFRRNLLTGKDGERVLRLEGFKTMLSCAELLEKEPVLSEETLKQVVINYGNLCIQVNQGLDKNKTGFHPLLRPFYKSLQEKLCSPSVVARLKEIGESESFKGFGLQVQNMLELAGKLKTMDSAGANFSIFKVGQRNLGVFCMRVLDVIVQDSASLQTIVNFVISHKDKIQGTNQFPELKSLLLDLESKAKEKGKTLVESLTIKPDLIKLARGTVCTSEDGIKAIKAKEGQIFPIIKEVAELLSSDTSKEARELEILFLRIFNKVKDY